MNVNYQKLTPYQTVLDEMTELHDTRQVGYGTDADPYANVRASEEWKVNGNKIPAWVGSLMRACDKIKRLKAFADTGKLPDEKVEDCFLDCANYVAIALVLYREQAGESK
jgi:hypothetical protein